MRYGKIYYGALGLAAVLLLIGLVMDGPWPSGPDLERS